MSRLDFFRKLAEKWKHRNDKYIPGNKNYVGHIAARKAGKAKCTCAEHGTWDLGMGSSLTSSALSTGDEMSDNKNTPNEISMFLGCRKCLEELPDGVSPREHARLEIGMTDKGEIQVWCVRHEENVYKGDPIGEFGGLLGEHECEMCGEDCTEKPPKKESLN